jgi:hypothetical protein
MLHCGVLLFFYFFTQKKEKKTFKRQKLKKKKPKINPIFFTVKYDKKIGGKTRE